MPGSLEPLDLGVQIPYHFRCPISLELMRDPVTVSTGQTYDRASIESWVGTGNTTCPVTRVPLSDFTLIPNHTLRRLIQDWCVANRSFGVERIPTPKQPADAPTVRALLAQATAESTPPVTRLAALRRLRGLARDSDKNRAVIASLNARAALLDIVFRRGSAPEELGLEALAAVVMFAATFTEAECASVASEPERAARMARLLSHPSADARVNAAALVEIIVAGTREPELRAQISGADEIFAGVVGVLRDIDHPRAARAGVKALFAMCLVKQTRHKAVAAGAAEALVERLAGLAAEKGDAERALATVELLCRVPSGCEALAAQALTVATLVKVILRVSERATEYAAGALVALCTASEDCKREAVAAGVVTQMLLLVQSDCTDRAKRKAQMLLKLLRDSWLHDSFVRNSDDFACSEVVVVPFS